MKTLVISIDFELRWGVLDRLGNDIEKYKEHIENVYKNVPWILKVFEERNISATWATVGAIGCESWEEFDKEKPTFMPSYLDESLVYDNDFNRKIDPEGNLYFAPKLIEEIVNTKNQELASHTFGHIYATEENVTYSEFKEDLLRCKEFFKTKFGIEPKSLVYPRNQVIYENELLKDDIISCYRGNEEVDFLSAKNQKEKKILNRIKIFTDSINPYSLHSYHNDILTNNNIPSSSMLRIYLPSFLRKIHLLKIKNNLKNLEENNIYHTWFHPHNLGTKQSNKDDFLNFCDYVGDLIQKKRLNTKCMNDFIC